MRGSWREGSFTRDPENIQRKALETGISLHRDPIEEPGGEVRLLGTSRDSKRGLWKQTGSRCRGSARGTYGGALLGTLKARSYQYPETGFKTNFGPYSDCQDQTVVL